MADKLKLSKETSNKLDLISVRLNLRRNVVCRLAIAKSFSIGMPVPDKIVTDSDGREFNKTTILGSDEILFRSISAFVQNNQMDGDFFNIIIRNHIERGMNVLSEKYQTINSPVSFLVSLMD